MRFRLNKRDTEDSVYVDNAIVETESRLSLANFIYSKVFQQAILGGFDVVNNELLFESFNKEGFHGQGASAIATVDYSRVPHWSQIRNRSKGYAVRFFDNEVGEYFFHLLMDHHPKKDGVIRTDLTQEASSFNLQKSHCVQDEFIFILNNWLFDGAVMRDFTQSPYVH
jgi:hypothetical protein